MKILLTPLSVLLPGLLVLVLTGGCQTQLPAAPPPPAGEEAPAPTPPPVEAAPIDPFPYEAVAEASQPESEKLSGVVFYPPRGTLFAVRDNGWLLEIGADGVVSQAKEIRKEADFEGITYSPTAKLLYIAVEGDEAILEVDPETLATGREIPIHRTFEDAILLSPEGNGIEGITFVPAGEGEAGDSFFLVNQSKELTGTDPSIVFEVEITPAADGPYGQIVRYFSVGVTDLSGLHYRPESRSLLITSDSNDLLLEVSLTGEVLSKTHLPGKDQEGITLDTAGSLYIAQDRKDPLLKYLPVPQAQEVNQ